MKLGIEVSERTISRLMPQRRKPPSQTWRAFLDNHLHDLVSIDFFTVPTATFRVLFVLVALTSPQACDSLPCDGASDRPLGCPTNGRGVSRGFFHRRVTGMGIEEVPIAPQSPWQNPYSERLIGSYRRTAPGGWPPFFATNGVPHKAGKQSPPPRQAPLESALQTTSKQSRYPHHEAGVR